MVHPSASPGGGAFCFVTGIQLPQHFCGKQNYRRTAQCAGDWVWRNNAAETGVFNRYRLDLMRRGQEMRIIAPFDRTEIFHQKRDHSMNVHANNQSLTQPSSLQVHAKNLILGLGNIVLYLVPIFLLAIPVSHWLPGHYLLLFVTLFVGEAIGALLLIFLEGRRIRGVALLRNP